MKGSQQENIYVKCQGVDNEFVVVSPDSLPDNAYDLGYLLKVETAPRSCWRDVAAAYFRRQNWEAGITVLEQATSDDVENVLRGDAEEDPHSSNRNGQPCSRLDLLAALGGAHIMMAEAAIEDPEQRSESLKKAADVFSRADKIDLDDPSIWAARGWGEFHASKSSAANWFDNARDKNVVLGAIGLAALHLNRTKPVDNGKDPVALLVSALRSDCCPAGVWTGLAYALFREGRFKPARNIVRRALSALRKSPREERLEAIYLLALIEVTDPTPTSVEHLSIALQEALVKCGGRDDARILSLIANLLFRGGDIKSAERVGSRAVALASRLPGSSIGALFAGIHSSTRVESLFQLARAQHHLGKHDEASKGFETIKNICESSDGQHIKINPGVLLRLGLLKLATGRRSDEVLARECMEKVLKSCNDRCGIASRALGVILGREVLLGMRRGKPRGGDTYERAVSLLTKGLEESPEAREDVSAELIYAALIEEYHPKKAVDAYRTVIEVLERDGEEVDFEIWNNLSSLLARCGDLEEACRISQEKIVDSLSQSNSVVRYNKGRLAELKGEPERAAEIFQSVEKGSPHYLEACVRMAVISMRESDSLEDAEKLLLSAKESSATRAIAIAYLGKLYTIQKNYKQAQEILESNRNDCDYLALSFSSFIHRLLDSLDHERRTRFLINHIGTPLVNVLKKNGSNACAANGVGVFFAESKMFDEARDAFSTAGSGPLSDRVTRVNLAHVQIYLGIRSLRESAVYTGRPSIKVRSQARSLYEQAGKLYSDALSVCEVRGDRNDFSSYCELLLYTAWAHFEGIEFRKCAATLQKLVHLVPSSYASWFNLGQALLECATHRVNQAGSQLKELELAKEEYEGSRAAVLRWSTWNRNFADPVARTTIDHRVASELERYLRQETKSHEVKLRNAIDMEDDRQAKLAAKKKELDEHEQAEFERRRQAESDRIRKEQQLREAFEESQKQQRLNEENHRLLLAEKNEKFEDGISSEENESHPRTSQASKGGQKVRKRKKKEPQLEGEKPAKKVKRAKRFESKGGDSGGSSSSEYSDASNASNEEVPNPEFDETTGVDN